MASISGNQEIARRYATALLALAEEQGQADRIAADLKGLKQALSSAEGFQQFIDNAVLQRAQQEKAILAVAEAAGLAPLTKNFLALAARKRRLALLPQIIDAVLAGIAAKKGIVTAKVISAKPLDANQKDAVGAALKKATGQAVEMVLTEDPDIMGGLVVRLGSTLIDASVRTKLSRMARALTSDSTTEKKRMKEVA